MGSCDCSTILQPSATRYARAATWAAVANVKGLMVDGFHVNVGEKDGKRFPRAAEGDSPIFAAKYACLPGRVVSAAKIGTVPRERLRFPRSAISLFNIEGGQIVNVTRTPAAATPPLVDLTNGKQVSADQPARQ